MGIAILIAIMTFLGFTAGRSLYYDGWWWSILLFAFLSFTTFDRLGIEKTGEVITQLWPDAGNYVSYPGITTLAVLIVIGAVGGWMYNFSHDP